MSALSPQIDHFAEDPHGITYRESGAPRAGLVIGLFGLAGLATSVALLTELKPGPLHGGTILGVLAVVACAGFGCAAIALAMAAFAPQQVRFDGATQRVRGRVRGRMWLPRSINVDASALGRPCIQVSTREAGTDLHEVRIPWPGHAPLALGSFEDPARARHWQDRLTILMNL